MAAAEARRCGEIVRQAGMRDVVVVGRQAAFGGQDVEVGSLRPVPDDVAVAAVFHPYPDDVPVRRRRGGPAARTRRGRPGAGGGYCGRRERDGREARDHLAHGHLLACPVGRLPGQDCPRQGAITTHPGPVPALRGLFTLDLLGEQDHADRGIPRCRQCRRQAGCAYHAKPSSQMEGQASDRTPMPLSAVANEPGTSQRWPPIRPRCAR